MGVGGLDGGCALDGGRALARASRDARRPTRAPMIDACIIVGGGQKGHPPTPYASYLGIRGYESRVSMGYGRWVLALASGDAIGIGHGIG